MLPNRIANTWPSTCRISTAESLISSSFCKDTGLIVFEVKDWALNQIQEANPQHFTLSINGHNEELESPLKQARTYCHILMDKIRDDNRLHPRFLWPKFP